MSSLDVTLSEIPTDTNTSDKYFRLSNAFAVASGAVVGVQGIVLAVAFAVAATGPGILGIAGTAVLSWVGGRLAGKAAIATYESLKPKPSSH